MPSVVKVIWYILVSLCFREAMQAHRNRDKNKKVGFNMDIVRQSANLVMT